MKSARKIEFGDFQTPRALADEVCKLIHRLGETPDVVLEPTAGEGSFLCAAANAFPKAALHGYDINRDYVQRAARALAAAGAASRSRVTCCDFFDCDWELELAAMKDRLLVLGNLPWVTNSGVAAINGTNLPAKENFLALRGISARTGKSNFDISEWMLIRLLRALHGRAATLAMLCKSGTARKFLRYAWQNDGRIAEASLYRIDAAAHFNASVDACLLFCRTGASGAHEAKVYDSISASEPVACIGLAGNDLVSDIGKYRALQHLEGLCPFRWRSGVKHDCAAVMELREVSDGVENSEGKLLELEPDYLFPLLKCSDLANGRVTPQRLVLVTQRFVGDDTSVIANNAPKTWSYLQKHRDRFSARKSSIYNGRVPFALFGIGAYAFTPWKVAVSGLHRSARFQVVGPHNGKPVFFDDASYYLPFENEPDARLVAEILNSMPCQLFLSSLVFPDSKRPITVELLQRLNLAAIAQEAGLEMRWKQLQNATYRTADAPPQMELVMDKAKSGSRVYLREPLFAE